MNRLFLACVFALAAAVAHAQSCEQMFTIEGTPPLTAGNYRTHVVIAGVPPSAALGRMRQAVATEGFAGIRVANGTISAVQETSGSGRGQSLRVGARKSGKGTRVDAVFSVQIGQMADAGAARAALCRIVAAAEQ